MLHKRTLLFLSPISWHFHNRQIPLFAKQLSDGFNVIYLDCSDLVKTTVPLPDLLNIRTLKRYLKFSKNIFLKKESLIYEPLIITLGRYKENQNLSNIDEYFFRLQLQTIAKITSGKEFYVWTCTSDFDRFFLKLRSRMWLYDFFDRYFNDSARVKENEKWLLTNSKYIFVNSRYYERLPGAIVRKVNPKKVIRTPVGYDLNNYLNIKRGRRRNYITVGYEGGISDRLDFELIRKTIQLNPDVYFLFVGPIFTESNHFNRKPYATHEFIKKIGSYPNVELIKFQKDTRSLAKIMSRFDIGWIPYNTKVKFNKFSTPNKFYEYCAVGLPIISTPLNVLKEYKRLVNFADRPGHFKTLVKKIMSDESVSKITERKNFAKQNNIDKKLGFIMEILNEDN